MSVSNHEVRITIPAEVTTVEEYVTWLQTQITEDQWIALAVELRQNDNATAFERWIDDDGKMRIRKEFATYEEACNDYWAMKEVLDETTLEHEWFLPNVIANIGE